MVCASVWKDNPRALAYGLCVCTKDNPLALAFSLCVSMEDNHRA